MKEIHSDYGCDLRQNSFILIVAVSWMKEVWRNDTFWMLWNGGWGGEGGF